MTNRNKIKQYIDTSIDILHLMKNNSDVIEQIFLQIEKARKNRRKIFLLGNGGSSSTASHFVCDLNKTSRMLNEYNCVAFALSDCSPQTFAISNDIGFEYVFEEQLKNYLEKYDLVIALSGSGNSSNIINAINYANRIGAITVGLTGFDGGKLKNICSYCLIIPSDKMYHIEDMHLMINHIITFLFKGYSYK